MILTFSAEVWTESSSDNLNAHVTVSFEFKAADILEVSLIVVLQDFKRTNILVFSKLDEQH